MKFVQVIVLLLACCSGAINAQSCLSEDDVKQLIARVETPPPPRVDKKLKEELVKMATKQRELLQQVVNKDQTKPADQDGMAAEYESARRALNLLAQESGGNYYRAEKLSDLNGVYEQVINDLGKVYSLGYKPTNATRDGSWRGVQVSIINRPDLVVRTRPGYYAQ